MEEGFSAGGLATDVDLEALGSRPRIVVVVRDHMSGLLYSVPSLRALRRRWPDADITLLTSRYSAPILAGGCPYIDRILPIFTFTDERERFARAKDLVSKLRTWLKLVGRVDLVVNLRMVGGLTLAFCATLGLPKQVGYVQGRFDRLLTVNLGHQDIDLSSRERNEIIIAGLGIEPAGDDLELWIADTDRRWARSWLVAQGHDLDTPLTVIHPGCHWGCNQWLNQRWSETANRLLEKRGGSVVVTGVAREKPQAEKIVANIDGPAFIAAGETTLGQFAALIEASDLVLAVDTAPTQVCQALAVPAVVMMALGNPVWNGPVAGEPIVMLQEWDNDNPRPELCRWASGACNGPMCSSRLEDISVTQVLGSVEDLLGTERTGRSRGPS